MQRSKRLSAAVLATALVGTLTPAVTTFGNVPAVHAEVAAERATADVRAFQDKNADNTYEDGEATVFPSSLNHPLTLKNKTTNKWYVIEPGVLKSVGLPAGEYTLYLKEAVSDHVFAFVDTASGKRLSHTVLKTNQEAIKVGADGSESQSTAEHGGHSYIDITLKAGEPVSMDFAATAIGAYVQPVEVKDGNEVAAPDSVFVKFKDGYSSAKSATVDGRHYAGNGAEDYDRHHFTGDTINAEIAPRIDYEIEKVEARRYQPYWKPTKPGTYSDPLPVSVDQPNMTYSVKRSDVGDSWGDVEFKTTVKQVAVGKVNFRLFRDENLDNQYSGDAEEVHDGYVNLKDENGRWFKVTPDALEQQGLPAGKYTVYMRNAGIADGFGVVVDSATGKRLPFTKLDDSVDATYVDPKTGKTEATVTDTGRFVTTEIEVKADETVDANFASTRIDASATVNVEGDGLEGVYFKDGDQKLDAYKSSSDSVGYVASDDVEAKTRHFFSEDKVTLGVNVKDGYKIAKVEAKPDATNGGDTKVLFDSAKDEAPANNEFTIDRAEMKDDFGRFKFNLVLEKNVAYGKVNFRLFRDENLDNQYSGDAEKVHDGYVNLKDENGRWFKVTPDALEQQGLPAGKYTVYMRNAGIADGFGVVVDSATGERLPFIELDEKHDATYIDPETGEEIATVTDTGTFVTTEIEVKENETIDSNFASSRIDAYTQVEGEGVDSLYFKDGDQQLDAVKSSGDGYYASDDATAKTRHFFSEDKVTLGVNVKDGYKITKVEVTPSATNGGDTKVLFEEEANANRPVAARAAAAAAAPSNEFTIDRAEMKDDFGRFDFVVTTAPVDKPTEEPTEQPTENPTEGPTEQPTENPTEEPTENPTEEPTEQPTENPTEEPSEEPTEEPSEVPTEQPSEEPSEAPSEQPTQDQTETPAPGDDSDNADDSNSEDDSSDNNTSDNNSPLPRTGVNVGMSLALGVALIALGAGLVFRRRKN